MATKAGAVVVRKIAVFLVKNAVQMIGNQLYDFLSAQIGQVISGSSFLDKKQEDPFKYSPVTDYAIYSSTTPELSI